MWTKNVLKFWSQPSIKNLQTAAYGRRTETSYRYLFRLSCHASIKFPIQGRKICINENIWRDVEQASEIDSIDVFWSLFALIRGCSHHFMTSVPNTDNHYLSLAENLQKTQQSSCFPVDATAALHNSQVKVPFKDSMYQKRQQHTKN